MDAVSAACRHAFGFMTANSRMDRCFGSWLALVRVTYSHKSSLLPMEHVLPLRIQEKASQSWRILQFQHDNPCYPWGYGSRLNPMGL